MIIQKIMKIRKKNAASELSIKLIILLLFIIFNNILNYKTILYLENIYFIIFYLKKNIIIFIE